ncbi:MAG: helix-turn-helix transcriptional regulator [Clostridia bacterium]|nr:helix-turn-helix transcriptional regulator [Clostridia bacterium]
MTQNELAALLHIRQNTLSQYENGVREIPLALLMQVALIFNTSTDYILELTDLSAPYERSEKYK